MDAPSPTPPLAQLLDLSADLVHAVRSGRSLSDELTHVESECRPGVQALTFHALRWLGSAQELLRGLAPRPPPARVQSLLCVALALLWPAQRPLYAPHTLVDQAVAAARRRTPAAAAFVNAVLRRFLREREARVAQALRSPLAAWNHPVWWIERLGHDWPLSWQALLRAANQHPPMTLRVNRRRCSGADYVQRLAAKGREARLLADPAFGGQAVVLESPCPVAALPGFAEGEVSVQDASAQRAALLLAGNGTPGSTGTAAGPPAGTTAAAPGSPARAWPAEVLAASRGGRGPARERSGACLAGCLPPGARVLDACAAPGGKTAHLMELADLDLLALDSDARRLERVRDTLQRLRLHAKLKCGDASQPAAWWDGRPFDAILLDAPCSASGIVRRHPDIRWLRREADIAALAGLQARLLDALWPLLKPGGRLLYATCSIFRSEGQMQIDAFLQRHHAAGAALQPASPGHLPALPDNGGEAFDPSHDGFYYALIRKNPPPYP